MSVLNYRSVAKLITDVQKPLEYLIPKKHLELIEWADQSLI